MTDIEYAFPTPIIIKKNTDNKIYDEFAALGELEFNYIDNNIWGKTHKLHPVKESFNGDVIRKYNMVHISSFIDSAILDYCKVLEVPKFQYSRSSWFTSSDNGDYAHIHSHGISDLSGVFYYDVGESAGDIFFTTPVESSKISGIFYKYHSMNVKHKAEIGKLIMFPGWLNHGVKRNEGNHKRISLSFNILFNKA